MNFATQTSATLASFVSEDAHSARRLGPRCPLSDASLVIEMASEMPPVSDRVAPSGTGWHFFRRSYSPILSGASVLRNSSGPEVPLETHWACFEKRRTGRLSPRCYGLRSWPATCGDQSALGDNASVARFAQSTHIIIYGVWRESLMHLLHSEADFGSEASKRKRLKFFQ